MSEPDGASAGGNPSLVLAGIARIDPTRRDEVIARAVDITKRTRQEPGCISFVCSVDLEDPNLLHVFLEWESAAALFAILAPDRVSEVRQNAEKLGIRAVAIQRYEIQSVGSIV